MTNKEVQETEAAEALLAIEEREFLAAHPEIRELIAREREQNACNEDFPLDLCDDA